MDEKTAYKKMMQYVNDNMPDQYIYMM